MRVEVSGNACIIDEQVDIPMASLYGVNKGKKTFPIGDIALQRYQITKFLETVRMTLLLRVGR